MARILVVDDSSTQLKAIARLLQKQGHETLLADDGDKAVIIALSELPDLILMDVVMPNLNGYQATRQITHNPVTKHIPIIMLTSKDQETDKVWAERQGASDYITKPPEEKKLFDTINFYLNS